MSIAREYNNNAVSSYNEYGTGARYNTLFANKLPETVPSMNFPTILDQTPIRSYDALTRDSDGTGYYSYLTGYGTSCAQNYFVAKCPENKFLRVFQPGPQQFVSPSASPVANELVSEGFAADPLTQIKNLQITLFYDKDCPHCKKTIASIDEAIGVNNREQYVQLKDVKVGKNEQELVNSGGYAVPFLVSGLTHNTVTGFFPLEKTLADLSAFKDKSNSTHQHIRDLGVVVYEMDNCPYCTSLHSMLAPYQDVVQFKNGLDPVNAPSLQGVKGFPHIVSKTTGKSVTGCPASIDNLIKDLK
jgi:glutaredoxin